MTDDTELQKEFEEWVGRTPLARFYLIEEIETGELFGKDANGRYWSDATQLMWVGWQGARGIQ